MKRLKDDCEPKFIQGREAFQVDTSNVNSFRKIGLALW